MTILDKIIASKKEEVVRRKQVVPAAQLRDAEWFFRNTISLAGSLASRKEGGIIAEFKRRSPSKGIINDRLEPADVARKYAAAGASGISVLTDAPFFGGSTDDLIAARSAVELPILRKDFIIDPYQVMETKAMGADVILLIAANLDPVQCGELAALAHELELEVLLELHGEDELQFIDDRVDMVGVNNRNLKTFEVDLDHSVRLCSRIDGRVVKVAESGLSDAAVIRKLRAGGFRGFLIGEYFMKQSDPGAACTQLISRL